MYLECVSQVSSLEGERYYAIDSGGVNMTDSH